MPVRPDVTATEHTTMNTFRSPHSTSDAVCSNPIHESSARLKVCCGIGWLLVVGTMAQADIFYVANHYNNTIYRFDETGHGSLFAAGYGAHGLALDPSGNLYAANYAGIERFDASGHGSLFASAALSNPQGMAFDHLGNLYVIDRPYGASQIFKFDSSGHRSLFATPLDGAMGLAFDSSGNLYVSNERYNTITRFDLNGNGVTFATSGLSGPQGIAFDANGNLFVANYYTSTIEKFDASGNGSLFANSGLRLPVGLAFDSSGNLYAANFNTGAGGNIFRFGPDGNGSIFASSGVSGPTFVVVQIPEPSTSALMLAALSAGLLHRHRNSNQEGRNTGVGWRFACWMPAARRR